MAFLGDCSLHPDRQVSRMRGLRKVREAVPLDIPDSGIELGYPALQADSLPTELSRKPNEAEVDAFSGILLLCQ